MDLLPIWDPAACVPRREVLEGTLTDADLALRLDAVVSGTARPPYNDPRTFFEATHLTRSMKEILEYLFGRIAGARTDTNPVIVLDVGFGGGKTHTLVTLYYAAKYGTGPAIRPYLPGVPIPDGVRVVAISGEDYGERGVVRNGTPVSTLWGDLFCQLGCLEKFRSLDLERQVPSLDDVKQALGDGPLLVLLDELPSLFNLYAKSDRTMMDRIVQFIQRLVIAVAEKERAALVIAIAEDAYKDEAILARETIRDSGNLHADEKRQLLDSAHLAEHAMEGARAHIRRKETIMSPVEEQDVVHILRRRLFASTNNDMAEAVANAYHELYTTSPAPEAFGKQDYQDALRDSYPFHPELVKVLYERLATLDQFQRTRGALRLLFRAVRHCWEEKELDSFLLHPHHIDLAVPEILEDLTKGIGEGRLRNALEGDLFRSAGGVAVQDLDDEVRAQWRAPLHRRTYITIYLYTLATGREGDQGIDVTRLCSLIAVPTHTDYALRVRDSVLQSLTRELSHIDRRGTHYLFIREPSPLRIIDREARNVTDAEATELIRAAVEDLFKDKPDWIHVRVFPADPSKVEDESVLKLAILNPHLHHFLPQNGMIPTNVERFITHRDPNGQNFRRFKNDTFLLVAAQESVSGLLFSAKKLKAAREARKDLAAHGIPKDRKEDVEGYLSDQEEAITDGVRATFARFVYYNKKGELAVANLNPSGYGKAQGGRAMFLYHLKDVFRRIGEDAFDPTTVIQDVWTPGTPAMSTETLFEAYHIRPGLVIPATQDVFKQTILRGIKERFWVIEHGKEIFTDTHLPNLVAIANDWLVWDRDEAETQGLLTQPEIIPKPIGPKKGGTQITLIDDDTPIGFTYTFSHSPAGTLANELGIITKRERVLHLDKAILHASTDASVLYPIRNLITLVKQDPSCAITIHISVRKFGFPQYSVVLDLNKDTLDNPSGKALYDVIAKLNDAEQVECALTLDWPNLPIDQLSRMIADMEKTASQILFSLEVIGEKER